MKKLRKLGMFFCMALIPILSACSGGGGSGGGGSTPSAVTQGVTFSVAKSALVAAKSTAKSVAAETLDPAARYATATIADANGTVILEKYRTEIFTLNNSYITSTIPLVPGNYQLTEFFIVDVNNKVLYSVPTQSATAEIKAMVTKVLPINFTVTKDVTSTTSVQVLAVGEATANDFGYPSVIFDVVSPGGVKFMTDVQELVPPSNNWLQIAASLKLNNVDYTVNAVTTTLRVPQAATYTLVYSKPGYITKTINLTAAEMANYQTKPFVVVMTKGTPGDTFTVTFNSNGGSAVTSQTVASGDVATTPANPVKSGYTFAGWYGDAGLTTQFIFSSPIVADITLYAKWTTPPLPPTGSSKVAKTGQTSCWDEAGLSVACAGTGQDGDTFSGAAWPNPRFTNNSLADASDLTQTDNLTGLIWTKNANLHNGAVTWQDALTYIKTLNSSNYLGHNDWRLPNIIELQSLVNLQYTKPANWLNTQGFINVQAGMYWSSTTFTNPPYTSSGNCVSLLDGSLTSDYKSNSLYVWPVRSGQVGMITLAKTGQTGCWDTDGLAITCSGTGQDGEFQTGATWPANRFTDNSVTTDTTVTDNLTGLMWMKNAKLPGVIVTWSGALDYVKNLNSTSYLGYGDWRLPNRNELATLLNMESQASNATFLTTQGFINTESCYYWTSDTNVNDPTSAWFLNMATGLFDSSYNKSIASIAYCGFNVWPVRNGL